LPRRHGHPFRLLRAGGSRPQQPARHRPQRPPKNRRAHRRSDRRAHHHDHHRRAPRFTSRTSRMSTDSIPVPIVPSRSRLSAATIPRIIWPIAALLLILLFNFFFTPGFFSFTIRNGRAYGSLIDVLNRGAPVMLLSLGMTLVIATGGIDLSVGAVMAIAGATAAVLISRPDGCLLSKIDVHGSITLIVSFALLTAVISGVWNGLL